MKINDFPKETQMKIEKLAEKNNCTTEVILLIWELAKETLEELGEEIIEELLFK